MSCVCTVVVSLDPSARLPLVVLAVRDELLARPWMPPAGHWPGHPGIIGGLDQVAGGTWLAADHAARRVSCVLNGVGRLAPPDGRRSRGALPLWGAAGLPLPADLTAYDPFHLLVADPAGASMVSWDGRDRTETNLPTGLTVVVNDGIAPRHPRAALLRRRLAALDRPDPAGPGPGGWGGWLPVAAGVGTSRDDPAALILRHVASDGSRYGSSSVTLIAAGPGELRYDFAPVPAEPGSLALTRVR